MDWDDYKAKYGLHDFTKPIPYAKAVLQTMKPKSKAEHLQELLDVLKTEL